MAYKLKPLDVDPWSEVPAQETPAQAAPASPPPNGRKLVPLDTDPWAEAPAQGQPAPEQQSGWYEALNAMGNRVGDAIGKGTRGVMEAGVSAVPSVIGAPLDATINAGRGLAYLGKRGAAAAGLAEEPDYQNYSPINPFMNSIGRVASLIPDAIGLPKPETSGERIVDAVGKGLVSAGGVAAGASKLAETATGAAKPVMTMLGAGPTTQAVSGGLAGGASQSVMESDMVGDKAKPYLALGAGIAAGAIPIMARSAGRAFSGGDPEEAVRKASGKFMANRMDGDPETVALRMQTAEDGLASATIGGEKRNWRLSATTASGDRGLGERGVATMMDEFSGHGVADIHRNNAAIASKILDDVGTSQTAERARGLANRFQERRIGSMLGSNPNRNVDITPVIRDAERRGAGKVPNLAMDEIDVNAGIGRDLGSERYGAKPVYSVNPQTGDAVDTGRRNMGLQTLITRRRDYSNQKFQQTISTRNADRSTSALPRTPGTTNALRTVVGNITERLDDATGGQFTPMITRSRRARDLADTRDFAAGLAEGSNLKGRLLEDGTPAFTSGFSDLRQRIMGQKPVTGANMPKGMDMTRFRQLRPNAAGRLDELADSIRRTEGNISVPGSTGHGSSMTFNKAAQRAEVQNLAKEFLPLRSRLAGTVANASEMLGDRVVGIGTGIASASPGLGIAVAGGGRVLRNVAGNLSDRAHQRFADALAADLGYVQTRPDVAGGRVLNSLMAPQRPDPLTGTVPSLWRMGVQADAQQDLRQQEERKRKRRKKKKAP